MLAQGIPAERLDVATRAAVPQLRRRRPGVRAVRARGRRAAGAARRARAGRAGGRPTARGSCAGRARPDGEAVVLDDGDAARGATSSSGPAAAGSRSCSATSSRSRSPARSCCSSTAAPRGARPASRLGRLRPRDVRHGRHRRPRRQGGARRRGPAARSRRAARRQADRPRPRCASTCAERFPALARRAAQRGARLPLRADARLALRRRAASRARARVAGRRRIRPRLQARPGDGRAASIAAIGGGAPLPERFAPRARARPRAASAPPARVWLAEPRDAEESSCDRAGRRRPAGGGRARGRADARGSARPGANDFACRSAAHPVPVILVHGTFGDMTVSWNALSPLLKSQGYCVFALDLVRRGDGADGPVGRQARRVRRRGARRGPAPRRCRSSGTRRAGCSPATSRASAASSA